MSLRRLLMSFRAWGNRSPDFCLKIDGVCKPKNSQFWARFAPPHNAECRCSLVECFKGDPDAKATPTPRGLDGLDGFDPLYAGKTWVRH